MSRKRLAVSRPAQILCAALIAGAVFATPFGHAHAEPGKLQGNVPTTGGAAAVVWGGGLVTQIREAALTGGCGLTSVWVFQGGTPVGHLIDAPAFVNTSFAAAFPGGEVPAGTIVILQCVSATPQIAGPAPTALPVPARSGWVDVHTHLEAGPGTRGAGDLLAAVAPATALMDRFGVRTSLIMPPPAPIASSSEYDALAAAASDSPDRFAFLAGGRSLNPMIHEAVSAGAVSASLRQRFEQTADSIVRAGAVGFGEITALHLSFSDDHPFEEAPPDHSLFLLLADIAAKHGVPINLHMEAVSRNQPVHRRFAILSANNPTALTANIAAFERLLAHNRNAHVVWSHVGWDNTGDMTASLVSRLLRAHPNLLIELKLDNPPSTFQANRPLDSSGALRSEWLDLLIEFPDRVLLGSDAFFSMASTAIAEAGLELIRSLIAQLPTEIVAALSYDNADRIYGLR